MEQFKIRKDGFKEIKKATLIKTIPLSILAGIGGLIISYFNTNMHKTDVNVFLFIIPILIGLSIFGHFRVIRKQKEILDSYIITIDNNGITREQHNTPTITISNVDVIKIIKNSNGSFTIKGNSNIDVIGIPSQIDDYDKLEKLLSEIKQISTKSREAFLQKISGIFSILTIGLMVAIYISKNKIIVGISGTILLVVLGYSFFELQRSKNIDRKTKNALWVLIPVTASIIGMMYLKLTEHYK